jgi:HAD superfamily hydrolase (TIGR01459 family)
MIKAIDSLADIADGFDVIVFDQWGVLHNGTTPYHGVPQTVEGMTKNGKRMAVLSNSGKRSAINRDRIASKGFAADWFEQVMTSGEALWLDFLKREERLMLFTICADAKDGEIWSEGLSQCELTSDLDSADAVVLMGLPENGNLAQIEADLHSAIGLSIPVYCSNPDRASPRADGQTVVSPGELAHRHQKKGGEVIFYGKPHLPIFSQLQAQLDASPEKILMVGDSLEHDIAGAANAGWKSLFVAGGLHGEFLCQSAQEHGEDLAKAVERLAKIEAAPLPDFAIEIVR